MLPLCLFGDDLQQTQSIAWSAVVMAIVTGGLSVIQMYNNRQRDKDKAEAERLAAKDKMEFDSTFRELKRKQDICDQHAKECEDERKALAEKHEHDMQFVKQELNKCQDRHDTNDERLDKIVNTIIKRREEISKMNESKVHEILSADNSATKKDQPS